LKKQPPKLARGVTGHNVCDALAVSLTDSSPLRDCYNSGLLNPASRTDRALSNNLTIKTPAEAGGYSFLDRCYFLWSALSALLAALSGLLVRLLVLLIRLLLTAALLTTTLAALLVLTTLILIILGHRCLPFL
jgi:hypothetical protein